MTDIISTIADICGIVGFLLSLYAVGSLVSIRNTINNKNSQKTGDNSTAKQQSNSGSGKNLMADRDITLTEK